MYVCDWYNPIKGHAQYSLRDERRDRHSGRIWRITAKGKPLQEPPPAKVAGASIDGAARSVEAARVPLFATGRSGSCESARPPRSQSGARCKWVAVSLDGGETRLSPSSDGGDVDGPIRGADARPTLKLLRELLARATTTRSSGSDVQQLRYWHGDLPDAIELLRKPPPTTANGVVRMEAAIAASYIGTQATPSTRCSDIVLNHPRRPRALHAITCCARLEHAASVTGRRSQLPDIAKLLKASRSQPCRRPLKEPNANALKQAQFDRQQNCQGRQASRAFPNGCVTRVDQFVASAAAAGQDRVFTNPTPPTTTWCSSAPGRWLRSAWPRTRWPSDPRNAELRLHSRVESRSRLILHASPDDRANAKVEAST